MNPYYLCQLLDGIQIIGASLLAIGGIVLVAMLLYCCLTDSFSEFFKDKRTKISLISSVIAIAVGLAILIFVPSRHTYQRMQEYKVMKQIEQLK